MEKTRIIFFDIKDYDREFFEKYGKNYNYEMSFFKSRLSLENVHLTKGYDVVCAFTNDDIGKETIDAMAENGVRLLAMRCAGFNNVSLKDIHNRFKVVRVPAYSPHAIAEYTVGLILAVNRKINKAYVRTREGNFSINGLMGVDLYGKTAGIIGTGKIGQILIKILKGFDMKVIAYDLFPNQKVAEELGFEYVSLDELYANSDIISLNCPLTKDTQYMINRRSMLKMKDGVILVNTGRGQLIDSADLVEALKDKKVLITSGRTKENIDPIRYLSNNSSGKMGYCLAQAAIDLGAEVTLISGPTNLEIPKGLKSFVSVESALEMYEKVNQYFGDTDIFIACAAVADYRPKEYKKEKIKKSDSDLILELVRNPDILFEMGKKKDKQLLIGFAAETNDIKENALKKLEKKNLDFIVANNASTMGNNTNTVEIIRKNKTSVKINQKNKIELAYDILKEIILDLKKVKK